MPYYYRTGMYSERHPFGADAAPEAGSAIVASTTPPASTLPQTTLGAGAVNWMNALTPVISGLIMATVGYGTARTMSVESRKALGIGVTLGVITAIGQLSSSWLIDWAKKAATPST
jgi:hypothetical protein